MTFRTRLAGVAVVSGRAAGPGSVAGAGVGTSSVVGSAAGVAIASAVARPDRFGLPGGITVVSAAVPVLGLRGRLVLYASPLMLSGS